MLWKLHNLILLDLSDLILVDLSSNMYMVKKIYHFILTYGIITT